MTHFHIRRLPHYSSIGQPTFLTWRLFGTLPANRPFSTATTNGRAFLTMDRLLDAALTGPRYLTNPNISELLISAIHLRESQMNHYSLHSWVIMANHVHLLVTPKIELSKITHSLKRFTAAEANKILNRTNQPFWQDETFDRLVRNNTEFNRIANYIEMNPVKAGLVTTPEAYPWSSATITTPDQLNPLHQPIHQPNQPIHQPTNPLTNPPTHQPFTNPTNHSPNPLTNNHVGQVANLRRVANPTTPSAPKAAYQLI